jgi:Xaa-Pro aminopeptidase
MSPYDINVDACRGRQQRLIEVMQRLDVELAIVTQTEHVQYLAGPRFGPVFQPAAALSVDGKLTLVAPNKPPEVVAADEVLTYEAQWCSTLRNDQRQAASAVLLKWLKDTSQPKRLGVEFSSFDQHLAQAIDASLIDVEPDLYRLRRRKDPDELARLRKAIAGTERMYARAREIITPGINELEVFNQLQAAAVEEFDEMMTGTGNDYRSGERGGPPRDHTAEEGELYILDLGPAFRGYFADNCRAICVGGNPTDVQQQAWQSIVDVLGMIQRDVKPGVSCKAIFEAAQALLDKAPIGVFNHHLGHGIGLFPHEAPHLNPNWDDVFEVGDVFTAEPGLYAPELRVGIRLEHDYLVTEDGVELLTDFELGL